MRALVAILACVSLVAQDNTPQKKPERRQLKDRQWFEGKIACVGCTLESMDGGAEAQCTLHARHGQGFVEADGTLWTFVDNAKGHLVITNAKLRDKEAKVFGWKIGKTRYIEVWKYQVKEGGKWRPYDYCKT